MVAAWHFDVDVLYPKRFHFLYKEADRKFSKEQRISTVPERRAGRIRNGDAALFERAAWIVANCL